MIELAPNTIREEVEQALKEFRNTLPDPWEGHKAYGFRERCGMHVYRFTATARKYRGSLLRWVVEAQIATEAGDKFTRIGFNALLGKLEKACK